MGVTDFDRDGHADYVLFKPVTDQTVIGYLPGQTLLPGWTLVDAADFSGDGNPNTFCFTIPVPTKQRSGTEQ
jgi:hypothetical protein